MGYVVKTTNARGEDTYFSTNSATIANEVFNNEVLRGNPKVELYDEITGEPFQHYLSQIDDEGDEVQHIWTSKTFLSLIH